MADLELSPCLTRSSAKAVVLVQNHPAQTVLSSDAGLWSQVAKAWS